MLKNVNEDLKKLVTPFWLSDIMYNESTSMITREDGVTSARLLFVPEEIISVRDVTLQKEFVPGKDYTWQKGTNIITLAEGSQIPFFTYNDIHGRKEDGEYLEAFPATDDKGRSRFNDALFCTNKFLYEKHIAVTYRFLPGSYKGTVPAYQPDKLTNCLAKLTSEKKLKVVFFGDSIYTGCDASGMYNRPPYQPILSELVKNTIEQYFGAEVEMHMTAVGGKTSSWGAETRYENCADYCPDLVVMSFGMNDGQNDPDSVSKNMESIINATREKSPSCNFIVTSCMVANKDAGFLMRQAEYATAFSQIPDVAFADVFGMHEEILKEKDFISMSGNNVNHPNDWLARIYAMNILSCLIQNCTE